VIDHSSRWYELNYLREGSLLEIMAENKDKWLEEQLETEEEEAAKKEKKRLQRQRANDRKQEKEWEKRENKARKKRGLPVISSPLLKKDEGQDPPSELEEKLRRSNERLTANVTPKQLQHRLANYGLFSTDKKVYVNILLDTRVKSRGIVQIPQNWQELFAPLLYNFHIRASYMTKAVGMCSIRALFDEVHYAVGRVLKGEEYFNLEEPNKRRMSEGRRAHKAFESFTYQVSRQFVDDDGKKVGYRWENFLDPTFDFVLVQEQRIEAKIKLPDFPEPIEFSGTPDGVFGVGGSDHTIFVDEVKTHVMNYSPEYLMGCTVQGLGYALLVREKLKQLTDPKNKKYVSGVSIQDIGKRNLHLLVSESLRPYDKFEYDVLLDDGSTMFIKGLRENMNESNIFERKTRRILPYEVPMVDMLEQFLTDLMYHRLNPRLFAGPPSTKMCKRFGGCKYIKAGCERYQELKAHEEEHGPDKGIEIISS